MTTFYLIRHGEPKWFLNEEYKLKGVYRDFVSLTDSGRQQATSITAALKQFAPQLILTSPYTRAIETAAIVSQALDIEIQVEFNLREWQPDLNFNISNIDQLNLIVQDYSFNNGSYPEKIIKTWESKAVVYERARNVLQRYMIYKSVIVVTHEQVIKSLIHLDVVEHCSINQYKLS